MSVLENALSADEDRREERLRHVAALRLRGLGYREIAKQLARLDPPIVNHETGRPLSHEMIRKDLNELRERWRAAAAEDIASHQADMLAEVREARRSAWQRGDLRNVYRGMEIEASLLGLNKPIKISAALTDDPLVGMTPEELEIVARAAGFGAAGAAAPVA